MGRLSEPSEGLNFARQVSYEPSDISQSSLKGAKLFKIRWRRQLKYGLYLARVHFYPSVLYNETEEFAR